MAAADILVLVGLMLVALMVVSIGAMPYARKNPLAKKAMLGFLILLPLVTSTLGLLVILRGFRLITF